MGLFSNDNFGLGTAVQSREYRTLEIIELSIFLEGTGK